MVLWVDKHRPISLGKLDIHDDITDRLVRMGASADFPHLLFFGPSGAGKKTRVNALIRELYGPSASKVHVEQRKFEVGPSHKKIDVTTLSSNHHIEINPSDVGRDDTHVVQEVIKEMAQTHSVSTSNQPFKIVVLNEADHLSREAQQALRRTMEKYVTSCRLILLCSSISRIIAPLRSRCVPIRVPLPSHNQVVHVLQNIASKERCNIDSNLMSDIASKSGRNMRKAILMMEGSYVQQNKQNEAQIADYERFIDEIAIMMVKEQSPKTLMIIRGKFYELLKNCIPPEVIIRVLTINLLRRLDDQLKRDTVEWAAHYEVCMQNGSKPIFHLEAFSAKFMAMYKRWIVATFGG